MFQWQLTLRSSVLYEVEVCLVSYYLSSDSIAFWVKCTDVVVAPPFVYLDQVKNSLTDRVEISAQNSWVGKGGAFTGEIRLVYSLYGGKHVIFSLQHVLQAVF